MDLLKVAAAELGIIINNDEAEKFMIYKKAILEWNKKFNLTAIIEEEEIILKHFIDSISIINFLPSSYNKPLKIIDVGSGAGFPGIPIKIMKPDIEMTLIDSLNKRINFLKHVTEELEINNVICIHKRAEEAGRQSEFREKYDICVSRAVASLNILAEYCLPLIKVGGSFIAMKGVDINNELDAAESVIEKLGGKIDKVEMIKIPKSNITHTLVIINKLIMTPSLFPRRADKIIKKSAI